MYLYSTSLSSPKFRKDIKKLHAHHVAYKTVLLSSCQLSNMMITKQAHRNHPQQRGFETGQY